MHALQSRHVLRFLPRIKRFHHRHDTRSDFFRQPQPARNHRLQFGINGGFRYAPVVFRYARIVFPKCPGLGGGQYRQRPLLDRRPLRKFLTVSDL